MFKTFFLKMFFKTSQDISSRFEVIFQEVSRHFSSRFLWWSRYRRLFTCVKDDSFSHDLLEAKACQSSGESPVVSGDSADVFVRYEQIYVR